MDSQPTKHVSPPAAHDRSSAYMVDNGRYIEIHDADERVMRDFINHSGHMQDFQVHRPLVNP